MRPLDIDKTRANQYYEALGRWQNNSPRSLQKTLGPSQLGGCREYVRATVNGDPQLVDTEPKMAAAMGTWIGDGAEKAFKQELGVGTQVAIVAKLPRTGLVIAGNVDINDGDIVDIKTKDQLAEVRREGPSLENLVQVSVYRLGAIQKNLVKPDAKAVLLYLDRSGNDQFFETCTLEPEEAEAYVELAEQRIEDVQRVLALGSPEQERWALRDKPPSWCFAVRCPFREACWGASEHMPTGVIEHDVELEAVTAYVAARDDEKDALARKASARRRLEGVMGVTPDGLIVSWTSNGSRIDVRQA